jgi:phosphoenolpyruvate---glycerone phosphotransferase subunit DhaL
MQATIEAWLRTAAGRIHEQAAALTALDQAIGDGDHGINMDRGFKAIVAMLDARTAADHSSSDTAVAADLLRAAGKTLISTVGGASGPLYGTAFLRAAAALGAINQPASGEALVAALEAAATGIGALGKAAPGEKTMLDAIVPAAAAARVALGAGADVSGVSVAAADAADAGSEATVPLLATKGRASYLGERSIGHKDPGATSAALLLRALADVSRGSGA